MCTPTRGALLTGVDCLRNGAMATSLGRNLPRAELPEGTHQLHGWFIDEAGEPVCGVFYAYLSPS